MKWSIVLSWLYITDKLSTVTTTDWEKS